ncbi:efflux RND transporter permease subunit [Spirochaeta dissipatitropha]
MKAFERLVSFLDRHGSLVLILTLFLMIASAVGIHQVHINTDFTVFMPSQSAQLPLVQKMGMLFGDSNQLLFLVQTDGSPEDLEMLNGISRDLSSIPGIQSAQFPIPPGLLQSQQGQELSPEEFSQGLRLLESISGQSPLAARTEGGYWVTIRISLDEQSESPGQVIADIETRADSLSRDYLLSGEPYLQGKVYHYVQSLLIFLPPAAILLLLLVFRLRIGSTKATLLSMIPAVLGGLFTLGTISWISGSISIISVLVPVFIIVLGSADGLHVTSHVMDRLAEGVSNSRAVASTLEAVGIPIIMTSLTTMAGFLSLMLIDSPAIREMGIAAAWGIALAGLATWIVLPVFLLKLKPLRRKGGSSRNIVLEYLRVIQGKPAIVITLILFAVSIPGIFLVRADFSMLSMYKQNTDVRQSIEKTSEILGGAIPVSLLFETDSVFDSAAAEAVTDFQQRIARSGITNNSISLYQALSAMASMMNDRPGEPGQAGLPEGSAAQSMLLAAIENFHPELIDSFYSPEGYGRAFFFLPDLTNETLDGFLATASEVSREHGIVLEPVSTVFAMKEMNDRIIHQQFYSLVLALVLVIVLSSLTQKSLKLGLLSGLPISLTLVSLFGFMGFAGLELSIVSGIMTGLTVGVGVDYAIHYISLYRYAKDRAGEDSSQSNPAGQALDYVASPILANAIGLAIGFSAMNLSPFRIHVILSLLMWVTMVLSAFFSLSLLPTLLGIKKKHVNSVS